jgi:dihydroflavonol-4-reductase
MKILLLGATGQIGYALTKVLAQTEHNVSVLVRSASGLLFPASVRVIEQQDFTSAALRAAMQDVDHVIFALGLPEQFLFDNSVFEKVNYELLATSLEAMRHSAVSRLTYISTYEVFGVINGTIRETHPVADDSRMTPYSRSKVRAYKLAVDFARQNGMQLTTIHPAAVFGGLNTGDGITGYMEKLSLWKWHLVPFINAGRFPVIHVDSLTDVIVKSLDAPGAYLVSDQMTTLQEIAQVIRKQIPSYVPVVMPLWVIRAGVFVMEAFAKVARVKPLTSTVQIDFLTRGWRPDPAKAIQELGWKPMDLEEGCRRFCLSHSKSAAAPIGAVPNLR